MSTVAWDGATLAADSMLVRGTMCTYKHDKIFRARDGSLIGGVGETTSVQTFVNWYNGEIEELGEVDMQAVVIGLDGEVRVYEGGSQYFLVGAPYVAIGSGSEFAMAAMHLGQSATAAVEVAIQLDCMTGGTVKTAKV